ncbi:MAG: glycosyl transferase, partial [Bifidobacterium crudilactis]|nr:glycosyl transferase [Bifidobacterium crudilactis]MDN6854338.1 glycosyl transferase [Bifidobacterium crudilactis]
MQYGDYRPVLFALGTAATFTKELIRLVAVDRSSFGSGVKKLVTGWWDSRKLLHDPEWKPMPPLK